MAPPPPPRRPSPVISIATHAVEEMNDEHDEPQPILYNADALKSLNGHATTTTAPRAQRDPTRRRAGAFQKFSPRSPLCSPRTFRSPHTPRTPRTPRRRCSTVLSGSPQVYKTVGEASVDRALGSMMHSLRLAASSPTREISRWSSSTEASEDNSGSFASLFWRAGHRATKSASTNISARSALSDVNASASQHTTVATLPAYEGRQHCDAVSIKSSKSTRSLRSVRSFASFRSARSTKSTTSTKSTRALRNWHWGSKAGEEAVPPIPDWISARAAADGGFGEHFVEHAELIRLNSHHPFKQKPRKIVEGFLKRLTPKRRPRQPQGGDPAASPAAHVSRLHDEHLHAHLGRTPASTLSRSTSTPFAEEEVMRSSAKALAVLGLIDSHHRRPSRPPSCASETVSDASHHSPARVGRQHARRSPKTHARSSSRPARTIERRKSVEMSKALPPRPHSAHGHATPTPDRSADPAGPTSPEAQPEIRLPWLPLGVERAESGASSVLSSAPSLQTLWGSEKASPTASTEELRGTPPPPPRRRAPWAHGLSSLSSSQSSLDIAHHRCSASVRSSSVQRSEGGASHMAEVTFETEDEAPIVTPRSKAMYIADSDEEEGAASLGFPTPRRSRGIDGSMAALSLDDPTHVSQRKARAAALAAASDPLKPRRLICQMRSRGRCRPAEVDFTRSPGPQCIPVPPSPPPMQEESSALPYGRKRGHVTSASVHTFGPGGMGLTKSASVDSLESLESITSADSEFHIPNSDTVERLYGQYGEDQSDTWEYHDAVSYNDDSAAIDVPRVL